MIKINRRTFLKLGACGFTAAAIPGGRFSFSSSDEDESLDVMIGQMLLVGFRGFHVDDQHPIMKDIRDRYLGAVVLFDYDAKTQSFRRNIQSPEQVKKLIRTLQSAASTPLLIAIDHEGCTVCRLKEEYGFPPTVSAQHLGSKNDLDYTRQTAATMAQTLADVGINLNLAPVVDLNINPDNPIIGQRLRSFSADPDTVAVHALEFIKAHHDNGILCTLKHFPGHGSSARDSHHGLVDITNTWIETELQPYADIVSAGKADAVMTAHVFNRYLDAQFPATLSKTTITGILRRRLNYLGVVISDDMLMGAITTQYDLETSVFLALEAGVDILSFANNSVYEEGATARVTKLIKRMVEEGKISMGRIRQSYQRIQDLKKRLL
jgi:beta-N-acetylhexosaminidase